MRVLLVHNRYRSAQPSGENAVVDEEADLLTEFGCTVERLEARSDDIQGWSQAQRALLPAKVVWSASASRRVREVIFRFRPNVVHVHNTFPLLSPAIIRGASRCNVPVVATFHNFRPLCAAGSFLRRGQVCEKCLLKAAPLPAIVHGCYRDSRAASAPLVAMSAIHRRLGTWTDEVDRIIFPSFFAREKYAAAGWPQEKLIVKHNTVRQQRGVDVRKGAGTDFLVIARLSSEKGVDVVIDAWRRAFPDGGAMLSIIGSGDDEVELRRRARGLRDVKFLGAQSRNETMRQLAEARALIVPSRCYEVFPRAIVEAFCLGIPVIASRIGALKEVVADGRNGRLVAADSANDLAAALREFHRSPELAERLGEGARRAYEESYAPEPTMQRLREIYSEAQQCRQKRSEAAAAKRGSL